jgi:uncharacterized protein YggL (DUF469 family)
VKPTLFQFCGYITHLDAKTGRIELALDLGFNRSESRIFKMHGIGKLTIEQTTLASKWLSANDGEMVRVETRKIGADEYSAVIYGLTGPMKGLALNDQITLASV